MKFFTHHLVCVQKDRGRRLNSQMMENVNENMSRDNSFVDSCDTMESKEIRSKNGTIRGVKNRVRQNIANLLQDPTTKVCGGNLD